MEECSTSDEDDQEIRIGYIYGLFPSDRPLVLKECRYIGKTFQELEVRFAFHLWEATTTTTQIDKQAYRVNWMRSVLRRDAHLRIHVFEIHGPDFKLPLNTLLSEREKVWIARGRRWGWRLTNGTDGGDGCVGRVVPGVGAKISAAKMGHEVSEATRAKISEVAAIKAAAKTHCLYGHLLDEANLYIRPNGSKCCRQCSRDAMRKRRGFGQPRKPVSDEARANMSAGQKGRPKSQAHKDALAASKLAKSNDHCPQGHLFDEENTAWYPRSRSDPSSRLHRFCKECGRQSAKRYYHQRKSALGLPTSTYQEKERGIKVV